MKMASHVAVDPTPAACAPALPWARRVQAKLKVGAVGDPLEHEADRIADQVMRMADEPPAMAIRSAGVGIVQRRCAHCAEEDDGRSLRRKPGAASLDAAVAPAGVHAVLRAPGQPLKAATRAFFEPRFGRDFSQVRIHSDVRASASARSIGALAFTVGRDIVFGADRFAPDTAAGRSLLAHELAHVVQQGAVGTTVRRAPAPTADRSPCSSTQRPKLDAALNKADAWLATAIPALDAFLGGAKTKLAQAAGAALGQHFHSTEATVGRYVMTRLRKIQGDIASRHIFRCPPASDTICAAHGSSQEFVAVVPDENPDEINLCAPFFARGPDDCASTVVHEFGHAQPGLGAKQQAVDRAYQSDKYFFYLTTAEALTNAESYAMFTRDLATGSSPAPGFIPDSLDECPKDWVQPISDAVSKARAWNHVAALQTPAAHPFSRLYKIMNGKLSASRSFKCIPDGSRRCEGTRNIAYWYMAGDLRVCPALVALGSADDRALGLLASLYGQEGGFDDAQLDKAAQEARRLHSANVPSKADVLAANVVPPAAAP